MALCTSRNPVRTFVPASRCLSQKATSRRRVACRYRNDSTSIEELTAASDFVDATPKRGAGPVAVAYDSTRNSEAAIRWARRHLCAGDPHDSMHLVHVVCDPRALASSGPRDLVAPSLQDYFSRLVAHVQAAVEAQCAELLVGIPYKVDLPVLHGPRSAAQIAELLLDRVQAAKARMLVVASHGPGAQADFGSVARYCYQHAPLPLVLVPGGLPVEELRTEGQDPPPATSEAVSHIRKLRGQELGVHLDAPAAQPPRPAPTPPPQAGAAAVASQTAVRPGGAASSQGQGARVLLVVSRLQELESHWQWVADNLCHVGDSLTIWHNIRGEEAGTGGGCLASLPTAIVQALRGRGLAEVAYEPRYTQSGRPEELAQQVREAAAGMSMVVVLNYGRQGMVRESLEGSVASELVRHMPPVPLVLLEPAQSA
ncbi:hypothetical protein V8C86DRAFT_2530703 [Haematococcus lacustris]